jgi:hypothetical protein
MIVHMAQVLWLEEALEETMLWFELLPVHCGGCTESLSYLPAW